MKKAKIRMSAVITRRNDGKFSCELIVREELNIQRLKFFVEDVAVYMDIAKVISSNSGISIPCVLVL